MISSDVTYFRQVDHSRLRFSLPLLGSSLLRLSLLGLLLLGPLVGCGRFSTPAPLSPELLELRSRWLTDSQPEQPAVGVIETRQQLIEPAATTEPRRVTVTGAIKAGRFEPWQTNQAAFVITDLELARPAAPHGGADHDPSTCPFCKRRQQDPLLSTAWVQCLDTEGNIVAIDARKLFGLKEDQIVVVDGTADIDPSERLVITVDQLFAVP